MFLIVITDYADINLRDRPVLVNLECNHTGVFACLLWLSSAARVEGEETVLFSPSGPLGPDPQWQQPVG